MTTKCKYSSYSIRACVHDAHVQFMSAMRFVRMRIVELLGDAALIENGEFLPSVGILALCVTGSSWRVIALCAANMLSRSRCLTRSLGRSVVALRQVRSYSAHANVPAGKTGQREAAV